MDQTLPFRKFQPEKRLPKILGYLFKVCKNPLKMAIYTKNHMGVFSIEIGRKRTYKGFQYFCHGQSGILWNTPFPA